MGSGKERDKRCLSGSHRSKRIPSAEIPVRVLAKYTDEGAVRTVTTVCSASRPLPPCWPRSVSSSLVVLHASDNSPVSVSAPASSPALNRQTVVPVTGSSGLTGPRPSSWAAPSFQLLGTKASATSLTRLLTTCSKFRWPFLRDGAPTSPRLTAPAAATSWGMTAGASPPIPLLCCCPSQHSSHSDPARALRASTSLPCSQPSVGLPSHSEEPSPAEARRAGDRQAIRACALRSLCSGSTGPRLLPLQPRSCSRAAALAAPSSWNPHPRRGHDSLPLAST